MMIMSHVVEVEIEGKRYIPLFSLKKDAAGTFDLTTIANRQSRAIIKVFLRNNSRRLLREIEVRNIPTDHAGVPVIRLHGVFAGRNLLTFTVAVNGKLRPRINIRLKNHSHRRNKWLFIIILLLLGAGIIFSSWLWLGKRKGKEQPAAAVLPEAARQPLIDNTAQDQSAEPESADAVEPSAGGKPAASVEPTDTVESPTGGKPAGPTELNNSKELTFPEDTIYFLPDNSSLTPAAEAKLRILVSMLVENPELEIEISGHCAPMGSEQGRVNLSFERARRVRDFLTASGWRPDITAKLNGAGSSKAINRNPEMQHLNRRVEILIIRAAD